MSVFSALVLSACWAAPAGSAQDSVPSAPNVVLIIIDTLRADKLGCYGFPADTSPELDELARQGVRFADVLAQCSWTRPSIGSMLTGCYPRTLGLYKEPNEALAERFMTLAEAFAEHGYRTFGITANPVINSVYQMNQGFQEYVDSNIIFTWQKEDVGQYPGDRHVAVSTAPRDDTLGKGDELRFRKGRQLASARDIFRRMLDQAAAGNSRGFMQANIMEMHESWRGRNSLNRKEFGGLFRGERNADYLRALRQVSADVKEFADALTALPGWEDTLFVVTSDHGQGLDDHPNVALSWAHGRLLYESHVKVPLIFYRSGPGLTPGVVTRPVRLLDLMPTVLDYAGLPVPGQVEGVSLAPLLNKCDAEVALPEILVTETFYRHHDKSAAYGAGWKYFDNREYHRRDRREELVRMGRRENGIETNEIADHPEAAESLRRRLQQWCVEHPKNPPTPCKTGLSAEAIEQMRAIGYLK